MNKNFDLKLYLVTDRSFIDVPLQEAVEEAIKGGVTLVQLREKDIESRDFYNIALSVKEVCDKYNIPLIINDRIDIALLVDASGVHLGQSDIDVVSARKVLGDEKIIGVSARTVEEAKSAYLGGADYLGVGAMYSTSTKTDALIVSKEELKEICRVVDIPICVIGGINENTIKDFKGIDIDGISVVSAILAHKDIKNAAKNLINILNDN